MPRSRAHVHLEIELESEPIAGLVTGPQGEAHQFRGWIELTEAIEDARLPCRVESPAGPLRAAQCAPIPHILGSISGARRRAL